MLALQNSGIDSEVITNMRLNGVERPFSPISILPYQTNRVRSFFYRSLRRLSFYPLLIDYIFWRKILTRFQPEVIHCHFAWALPELLRVLAKLQLDIPILVSMHGSDTLPTNKVFWDYKQLIEKAIQQRTILFSVPSYSLKLKAIERINIDEDLISVIPNPYNSIFWLQDRPATYTPGDPIKIATVGRLIKIKGHSYLLEAVRQLKVKGINIALSIIGDGPERNALQHQVDALVLGGSVSFLGALAHHKVAEVLFEQDIYVQPSITDPITGQEESFGVAVIEAIAAGLPVIVTECGGLPETVSGGVEGYALVVAQQNAHELAEQIEKLIAYIQQNKADPRIYQQMLSPFSTEKYVSTVTSIYKRLIIK